VPRILPWTSVRKLEGLPQPGAPSSTHIGLGHDPRGPVLFSADADLSARELLLRQAPAREHGRSRPLNPRRPPMEINWNRDVDAALREASQAGKPLLLDFTAAPM